MAKSKAPRKKYVPKIVGKPIMQERRDRLIYPAYTALSVLAKSSDKEAVLDAGRTIVTMFATMNEMLAAANKPREPVQAAMRALLVMVDRKERLGVLRPTGEELKLLREGVAYVDEILGTVGDDKLKTGLHAVARVANNLDEKSVQSVANLLTNDS